MKTNYVDLATGDEYWISGPRKDGRDGLYANSPLPEIDADIADEYWQTIRMTR